jgi:hypothetical protein
MSQECHNEQNSTRSSHRRMFAKSSMAVHLVAVHLMGVYLMGVYLNGHVLVRRLGGKVVAFRRQNRVRQLKDTQPIGFLYL